MHQKYKRNGGFGLRLFLYSAGICLLLILGTSFGDPGKSKPENNSPVLEYIRQNFSKTLRYPYDVANDSKLIPVPYPYNVPCIKDNFQMLFYWDTYYINLGLIAMGDVQQAKNNTDNLLYLADSLGFVPNANWKSMLNRSQPPYLCLMVKDIFDITGDKKWLSEAYSAVAKEYNFWMTQRSTPIGLNRHFHHADTTYLIKFFNYLKSDRFKLGELSRDEQIKFAVNRLSEAEAGCDFTPRFDGRCSDFIPVDLNCNLYLYEKYMAQFSVVLGTGEEAVWLGRAAKRKKLIQQYCWDKSRNLFMDYDYVNKKHNEIAYLSVFYPMWVGISTSKQARLTKESLKVFSGTYGIAACEKNNTRITYQWDYPNGWAPLFFIVHQALSNYHYDLEAKTLREQYISLVDKNFETTGDLWEKYNIETGTTDVKDEYTMPRMMDWTAAVYAWFYLRY